MLFPLLLLLSLFEIASALKCWHFTKELDYKTVRDKGLVECPLNHTFCVYQSVTAFVPREKSRYPVSFETTRCGTGWSYEEKNKHKYINLTLDNLCNGSVKVPHLWIFTHLPHNGPAYRVVERLNDVRCCTTDGCNEPEYALVGGGGDGLPWYKKPYNWFKNMFA